MKLDPLPAKRAQVEEIVNKQFPWQFGLRDMAYVQKRFLALDVVRGAAPTQEFTEAAQTENMTPNEFASLVLSKPDVAMQKETERRARILRARNAKSMDELRAVLSEVGWTGEF